MWSSPGTGSERRRSIAPAKRSASSYHWRRRMRVTALLMRTASRPRRLPASWLRLSSPASRNSWWSSRRATIVAGWWATGPYIPGDSSSTWRMVRSSSGADTGRRLAWARSGPASSSASRLSVTMSTPRIPGCRPSPRRAITPTTLVGTTTVTGARRSPPFARSIAAASVASTSEGAQRDDSNGMGTIVERGYLTVVRTGDPARSVPQRWPETGRRPLAGSAGDA